MEKKEQNNKSLENGRFKNTSAFNIKEAHKLEEISWSNNKFESTYSSKDSNCNGDDT